MLTHFNFTLMQSFTVTKTETTLQQSNAHSHRPKFIFVLQLVDGRYCIGQANEPARRIPAINTGNNPSITKPFQVFRIVGIKPQNEARTLVSVVKRFADRYGDERVVVV